MGSAGNVVEISSDEEDVPMPRKPAADWLGKLLNDDEPDEDDLFDLVVMGEFSPPQKKGNPGGGDEDDDDDCVVLDGDPDKVITIGEDKGSAGDSSSDELQIVGEKGPVACRDFPHSRHLCSNLPFNATSHVKHCSMCHCFVCDAPAPCNYWGKGIQLNDHCHATDKESKWKQLRQAFKSNNLPASRPEQCQNAIYPTMASSINKDIQCQVSSFPNKSSLLHVMSQNQQRHTSVRVSLNVGRTISTPRASLATKLGRSTNNVHTAQNIHSRGNFKRAGTASPAHTIRNANQFGSTASVSIPSLMNNALPHVSQPVQAIPATNTPHVSQQVQPIQRTNLSSRTVKKNAPHRSLSAPIASQGQQGQPAPSCQVTSNGLHGVGPQLSRCTSLMDQRRQFLPEPVIDVSTQSWQDILASVASDLGVLDDSAYNTSTSQSHQPVRTSSQLLDAGTNQGEEGLHAESVASSINLMTSNGHGLPIHTTGGGTQTNAPNQTLHPMDYGSSLDPDEAHLDGFLSPPADELLLEAAHQRDSSGLDSTGLIFDFELDEWT
ncbi:uncharacterized protein LOC123430480 [Hordeum vulgare subsp. vulgare]|uniref:Predicted protein n=1 Tax=Hordeum vulgare subsp. vulgare TaxID=112509 RepID=F2CSI0_HORVV|nr:uncharacterized protein LOC123430480 [Hordeum vulgare subsp. vulgare]XP_044970293.1 uncharacterized protein LOC123430480 [Hordeum vulgare subsp. vulgare]BAJ85801.1 predicted protein [Hordeum vulgare subsp. vulgare]